MKNTRKNHKKQRSHRRMPAEAMKRPAAPIASINITEGAMVPVPREAYDELLRRSMLVDILRRLHENGDKFIMIDLLESAFRGAEKEGE